MSPSTLLPVFKGRKQKRGSVFQKYSVQDFFSPSFGLEFSGLVMNKLSLSCQYGKIFGLGKS